MTGRAAGQVGAGGPALLPVLELATEEQVSALLHPFRRRVLAELTTAASPAEVARRLGLPAQAVNYHVHALVAAGLVGEVETRQKRNLVEHRFRALARAFTLSSALPLSVEQRRRLQADAALQQLVRVGDSIRADALGLLEASPALATASTPRPAAGAGARAGAGVSNAAAIEIEVDLGGAADRAAFVRSVTEAIRSAAAPFRRRRRGTGARYRLQVAVYPVPDGPADERAS